MPYTLHPQEPQSPHYDTAQICLNGHIINSTAGSCPSHNQKFCSNCGSETITCCPSCNIPIKGKYHIPNACFIGSIPLPMFCINCGEPYPWTRKKMEIAKETVRLMDELSDQEKETLKKSLEEIIQEIPETTTAIMKIKKIASKVGKESAELIYKTIAEIGCELAKKQIGL